MKGDFTRFSHQPTRYYAGVLMQQGRVSLDADWNEQSDIEDHRWRVQTIDTIGRACAPVHDAGFKISFTPDRTDLIIGAGRIYVDGLLVENQHGPWVNVDSTADERAKLSDMAPDGVPFVIGHWIEVVWDDPAARPGSRIGRITDVDDTSVEADFVDFSNPWLENVENVTVRRLVTYRTQPFYRADADPPFGDPFTPADWAGQRHLVYLDAWRRHVTAIEDPRIRELALGGPDTATRVQTAWAVRILFDGEKPFNASRIGCHDPLVLWDRLTAPKVGRMSARAEAVEDPEDPCAIKPEAGYRGLENRLYRVEIHDPGPLGTATFKWSRDNGSILASIVDFPDTDQIQVHSLGKDAVLRFRADDRVEVLSDESEMAGLPGTMAIAQGQPDEAKRILTLDTDVSTYQNHHGTRVRRWDQPGDLIPTADTFVDLDGIQVRFAGGPFETGDFWVIPARVATGDVEGFIDAPPRGIDHHFARLALIRWADAAGRHDPHDCRRLFPHLCQRMSVQAVSGDGQTVRPAASGSPTALVGLPKPLMAGVRNGSLPIVGAHLRFTVQDGSGTLDQAGAVQFATTDAHGLASVTWQVDSATEVQQVRVELLDDDQQPFGVPAGFTASLLTAARTAYTPSGNCADLTRATTVQQAIDLLCQRPSGPPDLDLPKITDFGPWEHTGAVNVGTFLNEGLQITFDRPIQLPEGPPQGWLLVSLEYHRQQSEGDPNEIFVRRVNLRKIAQATDRKSVRFQVYKSFESWARQLPLPQEVLCRIVLKSHVLVDDRGLALDGDFLGGRLPTGDGTSGGDFESWFTLTIPVVPG